MAPPDDIFPEGAPGAAAPVDAASENSIPMETASEEAIAMDADPSDADLFEEDPLDADPLEADPLAAAPGEAAREGPRRRRRCAACYKAAGDRRRGQAVKRVTTSCRRCSKPFCVNHLILVCQAGLNTLPHPGLSGRAKYITSSWFVRQG